MIRKSLLVLLAAAASSANAAPAPALTVYSAGSIGGALGAMLKRYTGLTGEPVALRTGPAGLMAERIEDGDPADLFVSANMTLPARLAAEGRSTAPVILARNRLCVTTMASTRMTSANMLDRLLAPGIRLGTSTPKADPGGDYAWALFDRAETVRPGAGAALKAKARHVVGGTISAPETGPKPNGAQSLARYGVDAMVGYCSANQTVPDASVVKVPVPSQLAVPVDYGMTVLTQQTDPARREAALRLALFLMSSEAQTLLPAYGFQPVGMEGGAATKH